MKKDFDVVKCVNGGHGFEKGHQYPALGWNNGVHVYRTNASGDPECIVCSTSVEGYLEAGGTVFAYHREGAKWWRR